MGKYPDPAVEGDGELISWVQGAQGAEVTKGLQNLLCVRNELQLGEEGRGAGEKAEDKAGESEGGTLTTLIHSSIHSFCNLIFMDAGTVLGTERWRRGKSTTGGWPQDFEEQEP